MKTKAAAFHDWLSTVSGMPAYTEASVPEGAQLPYATYQWVEGTFDNPDVSIPVNLWFHTESEAVPNRYVSQISAAVGLSGTIVQCQGGAIWIKRGSPWAQAIADPDSSIKRRLLNLDIQTMTN